MLRIGERKAIKMEIYSGISFFILSLFINILSVIFALTFFFYLLPILFVSLLNLFINRQDIPVIKLFKGLFSNDKKTRNYSLTLTLPTILFLWLFPIIIKLYQLDLIFFFSPQG